MLQGMATKLDALSRKLRGQARLLRRDPQAFASNLMQYTHPALFEERLVDIMNPVPMHVRLDPSLTGTRLNVLNPTLSEQGMTGGPNTILNLAVRIARRGIRVRFVTTVPGGKGASEAWLHAHAEALVGGEVPPIELAPATNPDAPLVVGPDEAFMATHWTTAQQLKPVLPQLRSRQFLYMLQEFEAGFYPWSSNHALALETYAMDFWPVVNEGLLAEYFFEHRIGRFAEPGFRERVTTFEPAIERRVFHPPEGPEGNRPRRLLFYARPSNHRNLFGLGLEALRRASADPALAGWEILAIGGRGGVPALPLSNGNSLVPTPWRGYLAYGDQLREADVLLAPMLSPHTGYPALEMAATGGIAVTNAFAGKTVGVLQGLSPNIVATEATVEGLAEGLVRAARRAQAGRGRSQSLNLPADWGDTLDPAAERLVGILHRLGRG